jgi:hypothetical protein
VIVAIDGKNIEIPVRPNITARHGESKYGDELVVQLVVVGEPREYPKKSPEKHIEFYLPKEFGIKFLKDTISFFEGKGKNREENPQRKL